MVGWGEMVKRSIRCLGILHGARGVSEWNINESTLPI